MNEKLIIFSKYLFHEAKIVGPGGVQTLRPEIAAGYKQIGKYKLLLRPLSSLTEEEWLGVFKAAFKIERYTGIKSLDYEVFKAFFDSLDVQRPMYDLVNGLSCHFPKGFNVLIAIEYLYSLHVDIHGAIEKGFAVDKTKTES